MALSEQARQNKIAYNVKRNKEINQKFMTNLKKEEYYEIKDFLDSIGLNKAQFIRWAYKELKKQKKFDISTI